MDREVHYIIEEFHDIYEVVATSLTYATPEDEYRNCRYCGVSGKTHFKSKAHLLPEFAGNDDIFCHNECDSCNLLFGKYETSLNAFGGIKNVITPIKSKKKYPKYKDRTGDFSLQFQNGGLLSRIKNTENDISRLDGDKIHFDAPTQSFIPLHVYKAIAKFALSLVEKKELHKFASTIDWLMDPQKMIDEEEILYMIVNDDARPPLRKPIGALFKKKMIYNCPEYCFVFANGFHRYQIFLQYNTDDHNLDRQKLFLPLCYELVLRKDDKTIRFEHYNMNSLRKSAMKQKFSLNFRATKP